MQAMQHNCAFTLCFHAACLKDLARFLRRDEPDTREVFLKLGELQIVENDVVPLLTSFPTDRELVYHAREHRQQFWCNEQQLLLH